MRYAIAAILLVSPACNWIVGDPHYCPPGQVENQALQMCVTPPACDAGVIDERNECVETSGAGEGGSVGSQTSSQRRTVAGRSGAGQAAGRSGGGAAGGNGGSGGQRAVAPQDAGMSTTGGAGGTSLMGGAAGMSEAAGTGMPMSTMPSGANEPKCGNRVREGAELCDGPDCPTECSADPSNPCVGAKLEGAAAMCDVHCVPTEITTCAAGDKCCPQGCNHGTDADCSPSCGDGVLTGTETCEPASKDHPCVTQSACDDGDPCTEDKLLGSAAQCSAACAHMPVTQPRHGDQCCPSGANANSDSDCERVCGNGVVEPGERCDGNCPSAAVCGGNSGCMQHQLTGSGCDAVCEAIEIAERRSGDGCCPAGANATDDRDCSAKCGNGVVEPGERCDGGCPSSCSAPKGSSPECVTVRLVGVACDTHCDSVFADRGTACNGSPIDTCDGYGTCRSTASCASNADCPNGYMCLGARCIPG